MSVVCQYRAFAAKLEVEHKVGEGGAGELDAASALRGDAEQSRRRACDRREQKRLNKKDENERIGAEGSEQHVWGD